MNWIELKQAKTNQKLNLNSRIDKSVMTIGSINKGIATNIDNRKRSCSTFLHHGGRDKVEETVELGIFRETVELGVFTDQRTMK